LVVYKDYIRNHWNIRNFPCTSRDAVRSHIALLFIQFLVLNLFKQYVLEKKYHKAQLKTLRTQVFDVFEDEDNDVITEVQYMEIVEFRNELGMYMETVKCLFSTRTIGVPSIFPLTVPI